MWCNCSSSRTVCGSPQSSPLQWEYHTSRSVIGQRKGCSSCTSSRGQCPSLDKVFLCRPLPQTTTQAVMKTAEVSQRSPAQSPHLCGGMHFNALYALYRELKTPSQAQAFHKHVKNTLEQVRYCSGFSARVWQSWLQMLAVLLTCYKNVAPPHPTLP